MSHEPIAHLYRDDEDTDPTTPPRAAEPAVITWMRGRVADADCNDPQCQVEMETVLAYDTLAQRVRDQQREITAWASTVADVEAALIGCPDADTLGARVRLVVGELAAGIDKVRSTERALDAYWRETQRLEGQLTAATQRAAALVDVITRYKTEAEVLMDYLNDGDMVPDDSDLPGHYERMSSVMHELTAALAAATPADHLRGATPMVDTVRECEYWKPIPEGGIAQPCNCGMGCDGLARSPDHSGDANKVVDAIAGVLLRDYQCRRPGEGEIGNFRPIARMCVDAIKAAPGGHGDGR